MSKSLLDWKADEASNLELMRLTTERWHRQGLLKQPEDVRIHAAKQLTDPSKRVNSTGRPRKANAG